MAQVADPLVRLVMGEKWVPAVTVIQALATIFAIQTLGTLVQPLAMAQGATQLLFKRDLQTLCLRIPIIAAAMATGGLPGASMRGCSRA